MKEKKLTGHFLYFDQKNLNGRTYSKEVAEKIVEQMNEMAKNGTSYGTLGYPKEEGFNEIFLSEVSHRVEEVHINPENKSVDGTIILLETPKGKMAEELLLGENSVGLSCRPRGTGEVNEKGEIENFDIVSFDLVPTPSDAFANIQEDDYLKPMEDEIW